MLSRLFKPNIKTFRSLRNMDELVQQQIRLVESKKKSSIAWELDQPHQQPFYTHDGSNWTYTKPSETPSPASPTIKQLALYSWNIDFMLPYPDSRMRAAIRHLQSLISKPSPEVANVVFLAECLHSDLAVIASNSWVQQSFSITDVDGANWQSGHYGTTTLVDKRLPTTSCFRVHYSKTRMERDGLFVDTLLSNKAVRLCNTHLESLAFDPPFRPPQMQVCAKYMHEETACHGAILAGDLNAIQHFDKHLHSDNHLDDAYLETGGSEDDAERGHTWGQQAATTQRDRFGTSRMDKVLFCGGLGLMSFERFGAGVEVQDEPERSHIVKLGFDKPWITDHLGVKAVFEVA